jgi:cell division protein FtsX
MKLVRLALKGLRGNRTRTVLTVVGVGVAVFIFCFFTSIQTSMGGIVTEVGKQNNVVVMEKNKW